jgi:hypothetical protein
MGEAVGVRLALRWEQRLLGSDQTGEQQMVWLRNGSSSSVEVGGDVTGGDMDKQRPSLGPNLEIGAGHHVQAAVVGFGVGAAVSRGTGHGHGSEREKQFVSDWL